MHQDKTPVHIALVADNNYRQGLLTTKASMIKACKTPERLVFHEFGEAEATPVMPLMKEHFGLYKGSPMAYLRLFFPQLLPDCDWVIYADVDTLWFLDPCDLWNLRDNSVSVQWVADMPSTRKEAAVWQKQWNPQFDESRYCCSGVMLMNLKRLRERNLTQESFDFVARHGLPKYVDQDILNCLLHNDCGLLPQEWDVTVSGPFPSVLHILTIGQFFGKKPGGRWPQFDIWYKFTYGKFMLEWWKRLLFNTLAFFYPILRRLHLNDKYKSIAYFSHLRWTLRNT